MICVSTNQPSSFESIERWRNEIIEVESDKPIMLILTKSDLQDIMNDPVTIEQLEEESDQKGF